MNRATTTKVSHKLLSFKSFQRTEELLLASFAISVQPPAQASPAHHCMGELIFLLLQKPDPLTEELWSQRTSVGHLVQPPVQAEPPRHFPSLGRKSRCFLGLPRMKPHLWWLSTSVTVTQSHQSLRSHCKNTCSTLQKCLAFPSTFRA